MPDTTPTLAHWTALSARLSRHGEIRYGDDGNAESTSDEYTVWVPATAARVVLADVAGLPAIGAKHPAEQSLVLSALRFAEHEVGQQFRTIVAEYSIPGVTESTSGEEPEEIGVLVALDYPSYTQQGDLVCDQLSGLPVRNSAGDVFDSVPQVESVWTGVHFVRRVKTFPAGILALAGTVNSGSVTCYGVTFTPRTARLKIGCRYAFDDSARPWELDITLEPRHTFTDSGADYVPADVLTEMGYGSVSGRGYDIGWDVALLECGFQYWDNSTNPPEKYRFTIEGDDGTQTAPQLPQLLKSNGEDGRDYPPAILVVRTATGSDWAALALESGPPSPPPPPDEAEGEEED